MKEKFLKAGLFSAAVCLKLPAKVYAIDSIDGSVTLPAKLVTTDYNLVAMIAKQC